MKEGRTDVVSDERLDVLVDFCSGSLVAPEPRDGEVGLYHSCERDMGSVER